MNDLLVVAKVNTDENAEHARDLGVLGIPTLIPFSGGVEATRIVGAMPKADLLERLEPHLSAVPVGVA